METVSSGEIVNATYSIIQLIYILSYLLLLSANVHTIGYRRCELYTSRGVSPTLSFSITTSRNED